MSWMLWLGLSLAAPPRPVPPTEPAPEPETRVPVTGLSLYLRGVGEAWDEPEFGRIYRPNALMGGVGLVIPLHRYAQLDVEVAYERMKGQHVDRDTLESVEKDAVLELAPISLLVEGRLPVRERAHVYLGAGPTATLFKEEHEAFSASEEGLENAITSGTKIGGEVRLGVRLDTAVDPVSVELGVGRRFQKEPEDGGGFDLAAWRASVGVGLSF